jgi:hypothetical protein
MKISLVLFLMTSLIFTGPVEDLQPGTWYEVPNSHMRDVAHNMNGPGLYSIDCVMDCWCGGAYDTKRDKLYVWGGGHGQYGGNEIYAFDMNALSWERINDPSPTDNSGCAETYSDGRPRSAHTYNYLQYLPSIDRFCSFGIQAAYPGICGFPTTWTFDFTAEEWETRSNVPSGGSGYSFSAVDPKTGFVFTHAGYSSGRLCRYNPYADTWTSRSGGDMIYSGFEFTAAIDPLLRKMVTIGNGKVFVWPVDQTDRAVETSTSGSSGIIGGNAVGFDYDPVSETFIAWDGGMGIYSLDLKTNTWTKPSTNGSNPGATNMNHTYGRFRYVPSKNVFVVANDVDRNVFIYRHTAAASAPQWYLDMLADQAASTNRSSVPATVSGLMVEVLPNPFNSVAKIILRSKEARYKDAKIKIYNVTGNLCFSASLLPASSEYTWNPSNLSAGIYVVQVKAGSRVMCKKLLLQK